jgi:hypothetical protein
VRVVRTTIYGGIVATLGMDRHVFKTKTLSKFITTVANLSGKKLSDQRDKIIAFCRRHEMAGKNFLNLKNT